MKRAKAAKLYEDKVQKLKDTLKLIKDILNCSPITCLEMYPCLERKSEICYSIYWP